MKKMTSKYSQVYVKRGIYELWHDKTWGDYTEPFYRDEVKKLVDAETRQNVILYGSNGLGKSMLMNIAMKDLIHKGKEVYVVDFRNLVKHYTKSWKDEGILPLLMQSDYLAIDDIGKEFSGSGVSKDLVMTALDYVLRYRFQRQKSTWITTNLMLGEFSAIYSEHIASLLKRNTISLAFEGEDYGSRMFTKITKE